MKNIKGSIFISTIIFLFIAMSVSVLSFYVQNNIIELQKNDLIALKSSSDNLKNSFNQLGTLQAPGIIFTCTSNDLSICYHLSEINKPQIDYNSLFLNQAQCDSIFDQISNLTLTNVKLSLSSAIWNKTCKFTSDKIFNELNMLSNIESDYNITLSGASLASAGYINLSILNVQNDLIVYSAGDIMIKNLLAPNASNITLISSSGLISINSITGLPKLNLFSKYGHYINGPYENQVNLLQLKIKALQVLSIR